MPRAAFTPSPTPAPITTSRTAWEMVHASVFIPMILCTFGVAGNRAAGDRGFARAPTAVGA
jgi:hypothetical protein